MPYDPYSKLYRPEQLQPFQAVQPEPQGWVDMGGDQPVNIDAGPAASAFKERFLSPRPVAKIDTPPLPHGGGTPLPGHEATLPNAGKGSSFKSL